MLHIDRILFPTDGSPCAEQARRHAAYLADRHEADLHVLHVEERDTDLSDAVEIREEDVLADLHMFAGSEDEEEPIPATRRFEHRVRHRSAAGGILSYAAEHDIDLIVMGTHGREGLRRVMLGSVAEEVVRQAECPVFTLCADDETTRRQFERMLVPIDFSAHADTLLAYAREIALAYGLGVDLLHVVEQVPLPGVYGMQAPVLDTDAVRERVEKALEERADDLRAEGVDVMTHLHFGHPAHEILDFAESGGTDLVVIATHGRTGLKRLLIGSVAEKVVRMSPCPVFTVKSFGKTLVDRPVEATARDEA